MSVIEVRDDKDGTDSLNEELVARLHKDSVWLRGKEWYAERETLYRLLLTQYTEHDGADATGPKVRVTFTVHIEDVA